MMVSTKLLRNLAAGLTALGFDAEDVLDRCNVASTDLNGKEDDDRRVPVEVLNRFWRAAIEVTGDGSIGVRVGALARIDMFGVLGHVARASSTLGEALLKTARYVRLWNDAASLSFFVEGDSVLLWYKWLAPKPAHYANGDAILSTLVVLARELAGRHLMLDEARFAHARPSGDSYYREVFEAPTRFNQLEYALVFPVDILMGPIATYDSELRDTLTQEVSRLVDALPPDQSFTSRVRNLLMSELRGGNPMIENIAAQLEMHPRTLTRRLRDEGTSHRELLESLRRELAERYLSAAELNVTEVAFLLGFSHASAFNKAFKRWFGMAPLNFRERARS